MLCAALLFGCGQSSSKLTSADLKTFDGATPQLKQNWAQAQAAAATNDYVQAIVTLRSMLSANLSKEQIEAVHNALSACDAKLMKAVNRGDAAAQKALETLRSPGTQMPR
jgi:hypothetical protein